MQNFLSAAAVRTRKYILVLATVTATVTACAGESPTSPANKGIEGRARSTDYRCVRPAAPDVPADTVQTNEEGGCLPGYDHVPWG